MAHAPRRVRTETFCCVLIAIAILGLGDARAVSTQAGEPTLASAKHGDSRQTPEFDLLIKNGHVIDPKNGVDAVLDVAVAGGKIASVAANIAPSRARAVADASGFYVTPGLIDMHSHVFWGSETDAAYSNGYSAVQPDSHSLRSGQTTLVDAGGSGWRNFPQFKEQVLDRSKTMMSIPSCLNWLLLSSGVSVLRRNVSTVARVQPACET